LFCMGIIFKFFCRFWGFKNLRGIRNILPKIYQQALDDIRHVKKYNLAF